MRQLSKTLMLHALVCVSSSYERTLLNFLFHLKFRIIIQCLPLLCVCFHLLTPLTSIPIAISRKYCVFRYFFKPPLQLGRAHKLRAFSNVKTLIRTRARSRLVKKFLLVTLAVVVVVDLVLLFIVVVTVGHESESCAFSLPSFCAPTTRVQQLVR